MSFKTTHTDKSVTIRPFFCRWVRGLYQVKTDLTRAKKMRSIIPWLGGKSLLAKTIIPLIPQHTCYVEPFAGAGNVFFKKKPSNAETLNDLNSDLVTLYRVVKHHLAEFVAQFRYVLIAREEFQRLMNVNPKTLTDIQRAARFYYLVKSAYGAKAVGQTYGYSTTHPPRLNILRMEEELSAAHQRLH